MTFTAQTDFSRAQKGPPAKKAKAHVDSLHTRIRCVREETRSSAGKSRAQSACAANPRAQGIRVRPGLFSQESLRTWIRCARGLCARTSPAEDRVSSRARKLRARSESACALAFFAGIRGEQRSLTQVPRSEGYVPFLRTREICLRRACHL